MIVRVVNLDDGPGFEHGNMRFFAGLNGPCFLKKSLENRVLR
jgi:hypothetical protein